MTSFSHLFILEDVAVTAEWMAAAMRAEYPALRVDLCGRLSDARLWLARQPEACTPLCLVDLGLPDGSGNLFIEALLHRFPAAIAIVTTLFDDDRSILTAMAAGAAGYVLKDQESAAFAKRIAAVEQGDVPMSPAISRRILEQFRTDARLRVAAEDVALTIREAEILGLLGRGMRVGEIAKLLGLSDQTVPGYLKTIYRKLGITTRAEAAVEAARRRLI